MFSDEMSFEGKRNGVLNDNGVFVGVTVDVRVLVGGTNIVGATVGISGKCMSGTEVGTICGLVWQAENPIMVMMKTMMIFILRSVLR
jgi:hypothetical protein